MSLPVPGTGRPPGHSFKFTGRCDAHRYCSDCKTRRRSNAGNRRMRRLSKQELDNQSWKD